jgi:hypothetical protein
MYYTIAITKCTFNCPEFIIIITPEQYINYLRQRCDSNLLVANFENVLLNLQSKDSKFVEL